MSTGRKAKSHRRLPVVDPDAADLPVAGTGALSSVRKSRRGKWRALVLIAVHLLIAGHIAHFLLTGRTLSPVEPSEAMYSLELGFVNAGFLFLLVALIGTLIFGRFFCGWGCHLVALQDLCAWMMKKLGVHPRPFRSRLLLLIPLAVAFYMFFWPTLLRLAGISQAGFPGFSNHLMTSGFWDTFPGPLFSTLTFLVCGFAAVYFLGSKGFCTYGCPYGALFVAADLLAPLRIVVNDDCEGCGHCTVTCTSNVRVHEEVRLYGTVVNPGCMKCTDCVSVCPKNALRLAFTAPPILRRSAGSPVGRRRFTLPLGEEIFLLLLCAGATLAFRGLYDGPPLLLSVALGGLTAFAGLKLWRLLRQPAVMVQNLRLKAGGRMRAPGWAFLVLGLAWLGFATHSGFVQWHRARGSVLLNRTDAPRMQVLSGRLDGETAGRNRRTAAASLHHFSLADRWGIVGVPEVKLGMAWGFLLTGDIEAAEAAIRSAADLAPDQPQLHQNLVDFLLAQGRLGEAVSALERKIRLAERTADDYSLLGGLLAETGRLEEAVAPFETSLALAPNSAETHYNLGGLHRRAGRLEQAIEHLKTARGLDPTDPEIEIELGLAYQAKGLLAEARTSLRRAVELAPDSPESRLHLRDILEKLEGRMGNR